MDDELSSLGDADIKFVEEICRQAYAAEIDRKDKILSSMTVVSAPIAIIIASFAFLAGAAIDPTSDYVSRSPDDQSDQAVFKMRFQQCACQRCPTIT